MSTQTQAEEQFSVALDSIQSKRRIEHVLEAANALLDRYSTQPEPAARLRFSYELIRRNFAPNVTIKYGDMTLGVDGSNDAPPGGEIFHCKLPWRDGRDGSLTASCTTPGPLGLTGPEWLSAMRLLAGISGLAVDGG